MNDMASMVNAINQQRGRLGFLTVEEVLQLAATGNNILDPFSVLISKTAKIGTGNRFYPGVILQVENEGVLEIGNENIFYPAAILLADQGRIQIGSSNQFGDGGVRIKANMPTAVITVGDYGRYINSPQIIGKTTLGSGSQIIGAITVQNCEIEGGGSFQHPDPDERAGVLKGSGLARNITVHKGEVLNGEGNFDQSKMERQAVYHPKK